EPGGLVLRPRRGRKDWGQPVVDLLRRALGEAAVDAAPAAPPGQAPGLRLLAHRAEVEAPPHLARPPLVERRAAAGAQAEAAQVEPARLVVRRAAALLLHLEGGVHKRPRAGRGPTLTGAPETPPHPLHHAAR